MRCKKVCLIINPRDGQNLAKITDILTVLAAAGWDTDLAIKEHPGHTMKLAAQAARKDYDLVIAYGGDGTLNQVVNGVIHGKKSIVGTIPGGTANVWATEVHIPNDPVKATLALLNSDVRKVDVGYIEVVGLSFPSATSGQEAERAEPQPVTIKSRKKARNSSKSKHHFLLMAGLGIDAAVMGHVDKSLKHKIGVAAVGLTIAKELPTQHPFSVEIRSMSDDPDSVLLWRGEALQVVIGNTRRYANMVEMTPDAYMDDGILDVCVITAGTPLSTMQQIAALFLQRKPDNLTADYFRGAHLLITVPASISFQVDGSAVKLKDYLSKSECKALENAQDAEHVMVTYRFEADPQALRVAIPRSYDNTLFEESHSAENKEISGSHKVNGDQQHEGSHDRADTGQSQASSTGDAARHNGSHTDELRAESPEVVQELQEQGRKVTVVGIGPNPGQAGAYIVAGKVPRRMSGEMTPVAVCIDAHTTIMKHTGEHVPPAAIQALQDGQEIIVEGKKSKRGVMKATRVLLKN